MKANDSEFLTEEGLEMLLTCSKSAIYKWTHEGMPVKYFSGLVRYEKQAVLKWLEDRGQKYRNRDKEK